MKYSHSFAFTLGLLGILAGGVLDLFSAPIPEAPDYPAPVSQVPDPCYGLTLATGRLTYTDHGMELGHFAIGDGFAGQMRLGNVYLQRVIENRDKAVDMVLRVREPRKLEKVEK